MSFVTPNPQSPMPRNPFIDSFTDNVSPTSRLGIPDTGLSLKETDGGYTTNPQDNECGYDKDRMQIEVLL